MKIYSDLVLYIRDNQFQKDAAKVAEYTNERRRNVICFTYKYTQFLIIFINLYGYIMKKMGYSIPDKLAVYSLMAIYTIDYLDPLIDKFDDSIKTASKENKEVDELIKSSNGNLKIITRAIKDVFVEPSGEKISPRRLA